MDNKSVPSACTLPILSDSKKSIKNTIATYPAEFHQLTIGVHKDVITKFYESKLVAGFQDSNG